MVCYRDSLEDKSICQSVVLSQHIEHSLLITQQPIKRKVVVYDITSRLLIGQDLYISHVFEPITEFILLPYDELAQDCIVFHILSGSEEFHLSGVEFHFFQTSFGWRPYLTMHLC